MNKSFLTNLIAGLCVTVGLICPAHSRQPILNIGLFALSGAITNWLAIYMLFEKIPGIFGSGVIPNQFEDFKAGIHNLVMEQFFNEDNIIKFFKGSDSRSEESHLNLEPIIEETDLNPAFDAVVSAIVDSSFGGMLGMFGGPSALEGLRQPFIIKMKGAFKDIANSKDFQSNLMEKLNNPLTHKDMLEKADQIVKKRLNELTPQIVKEIIQKMIREHLGWLVVWGGVFGGIIGLLTVYIHAN